jgi:glyceraldehyde-3-phosphate dehydrogenase (NAD(P))
LPALERLPEGADAKSRVVVLGMGVIGKRAVRAVARHPNLTLAGVVVRSAAGPVQAAPELPYYHFDTAAEAVLRAAGRPTCGDFGDALANADIVADCGPARSGVARLPAYLSAGVRAVFCGGERDLPAATLVHPALNLEAAVESRACQLVSCNTTALGRLVAAVNPAQIGQLEAVILKCGADADKAAKGITNGLVLPTRPSHHSADLTKLVPGLDITSTEATVPMLSGHVIHVRLATRMPVPVPSVPSGPRLLTRTAAEALSTAALKDALWRRQWHDRYEVVIQPVRLGADLHELWLSLDNEAVTIPELLDVLTVMAGCTAPAAARAVTDQALGIARSLHELVDHPPTQDRSRSVADDPTGASPLPQAPCCQERV